MSEDSHKSSESKKENSLERDSPKSKSGNSLERGKFPSRTKFSSKKTPPDSNTFNAKPLDLKKLSTENSPTGFVGDISPHVPRETDPAVQLGLRRPRGSSIVRPSPQEGPLPIKRKSAKF